MSYNKHNWKSGDVLYAEQLNALEDQVVTNEEAIAALFEITSPEIAITTFEAVPNKAEFGSTISNIALTYAMNKAPKMAFLNGALQAISSKSGTINLTGLNLTQSATWVMSVVDEKNNNATKSVTLVFANRIYYGAALPPNNEVDSSFLMSLSANELVDNKEKTFTVNATDGKYIWFAAPNRFGTCLFSVNGFVGGFTKVAAIDHMNALGYTETYDVYRSDNASLGSTTVTVQ